MAEFLTRLLSSGPFIPHGHCYLWNTGLVWLHLLSDTLIALAYFSIPLTLLYFVKNRKDLPFAKIFLLFSAFIIACGLTHLMEIWTLWYPTYWLSGAMKAVTAVISLFTAVTIIPLVPLALALPNPDQMKTANKELKIQISERQRAETALRNSNNITGFLGIGNDITDRKRALTSLRESEERLQALIDNAGSVIYIKNPQGQYLLINRQYETLFHLEKKAVQGKTDHDIFPKAIADTFRANDLKVIAAGAPIELEEVAPQSDGLHTYLSVKFPLFDSEGKIYAVCGISTDISDRKTAEVHLRQQEAFLKSIYDGTEQAIFVVDIAEDGELRYINFNPVSEKYAGVTNAEIQDKTPEEAFGVTLGSILRQNYERCLQTGTSISYEEQLNFNANIIWTLTTLVPLRDTQGQIYRMIGTATDISDLKTAELELQQQKQDLARSNDELQQFAYVASHDLQEPLRMITSYLELLERRYKGQLDPKADQFIAYAVDGAARMQILINDLLQYSRVGSRRQSLEQVDCEVVLQNVLRNLQVAIAENKAVITHDVLPQVNADITQLTQLFQNLIGNAIKFHGEDPSAIHIGIEQRNDKWLFSVCDNGIGIESQYVDRIFVIFQRLHNRTDYPGTGMGLAICKKIVERHSGNLWVESTPKQGSTFYFTLPVLAVSAP